MTGCGLKTFAKAPGCVFVAAPGLDTAVGIAGVFGIRKLIRNSSYCGVKSHAPIRIFSQQKIVAIAPDNRLGGDNFLRFM
jgi:hypothetical protein